MRCWIEGYGVLESITREEYRGGDWEYEGEDEFTSYTVCYSPSLDVYRFVWDAGDHMASMNFSEAKDAVLDLFDTLYQHLTPGESRHAEIRNIYAYLAGYYPEARMTDCFDVVQDICMFCASPESVYPYPDGEKWTEEEIARFHRWQTVRNWRDEE